jgi:hypothetical protein
MTLCANPDCVKFVKDGLIYCSEFCQRESRRIHGKTFHASEIVDILIRTRRKCPYTRDNKADEMRSYIWERAINTAIGDFEIAQKSEGGSNKQ